MCYWRLIKCCFIAKKDSFIIAKTSVKTTISICNERSINFERSRGKAEVLRINVVFDLVGGGRAR